MSAIPGIGGPALEIFNAIIAPPLERRRAEWMEQLAQAFQVLKAHVGRLEELQSNEAFIDSVIQASRIAVSNNQHEKIDALKNAIINSGISHNLDRSLQQIFLSYVDTFSVWHLKILDLADDPQGWFGRQPGDRNYQIGGLADMIEKAFPELQNREDFYRIIWKDLYAKGLVGQESLHVMGADTLSKKTTTHGSRFVSFIKAPPVNK